MTSTYTGQLILGIDKRNPLFTVYHPEEGDQEQPHVYYVKGVAGHAGLHIRFGPKATATTAKPSPGQKHP